LNSFNFTAARFEPIPKTFSLSLPLTKIISLADFKPKPGILLLNFKPQNILIQYRLTNDDTLIRGEGQDGKLKLSLLPGNYKGIC
jgi:hypothetical protein